MPAKNPRLTITIEPMLHAQLRRLSELTGNSQSALIAELLEGAGPTLDRVIKVLEIAQTAKDSIKGKLAEEMQAAQEKVETQLGLTLDAFEEMPVPLLEMAEAIERRSRRRSQGHAGASRAGGIGSAGKGAPPRGERGPARTVLTPISNRGVRSGQETREKPIRARTYDTPGREKSKPAKSPQKLDKTTVEKGARK